MYLAFAIQGAKSSGQRENLYSQLVTGAFDTYRQKPHFFAAVELLNVSECRKAELKEEWKEFFLLFEGIIRQTVLRVFEGESLQAQEKILS